MAYAPSNKIIDQIQPRRILNHRSHRIVRNMLSEVLNRPVLTIADTELATEGVSLYRLSDPVNQYFKKRL